MAKKKKWRCVIGQYCSRHDFIHGAEAEELRQAFEKLRDGYDRKQGDCAVLDAGDVAHELTLLLDKIDARGSVAWLEFTKKESE